MIETERMAFRKYTMDDLDFFASLWRNPEVVRFIGNGEPKTRSEAAERLEKWIAVYESGLGMYLAMDKESGKSIGHAGLMPQMVDGASRVEIGYWLSPSYWGQGLAKEAAAGFRDYGLEVLDQPNLISLINPNNPASIFVARRIGMSYEKTTKIHGNPVLVYFIENS